MLRTFGYHVTSTKPSWEESENMKLPLHTGGINIITNFTTHSSG